MLEREIERKAGERVKAAGGLWLKWVSPGMAGVPDRILIAPGGRVVFVELKQEREPPALGARPAEGAGLRRARDAQSRGGVRRCR